jgi:hypothetical protein
MLRRVASRKIKKARRSEARYDPGPCGQLIIGVRRRVLNGQQLYQRNSTNRAAPPLFRVGSSAASVP